MPDDLLVVHLGALGVRPPGPAPAAGSTAPLGRRFWSGGRRGSCSLTGREAATWRVLRSVVRGVLSPSMPREHA